MSEEIDNKPIIVSFKDEEGNELLCIVNAIIEGDAEGDSDDKKVFAIMSGIEIIDGVITPIVSADALVARVEIDENGENTYVDPTDEEFLLVTEILGNYREVETQEEL